MRENAVTLFPHPDSPTIARVSFFSNVYETPVVAGYHPDGSLKAVLKLLTSSIYFMAAVLCIMS